MSQWASFKSRFTKNKKADDSPASGEATSSGGDAKAPSAAVENARAFAEKVRAKGRAAGTSVARSAAIAAGREADPSAPCRVGFLGVARDRKLLVWARDGAEIGPHTAVLSERYAALGRRVVARADPPGWDDVADGSSKPREAGGGALRAIKLPVCDLEGTTAYVVAFGAGYPLAKAQGLCERLALLLGPLVENELALLDLEKKARGVSPEGARRLREVLEREIAAANSDAKLRSVANQVEEVRAIMERNVETILDRGERLDALERKGDDLRTATGMFRKKARQLKRWHLMNQVKWGVAVGTLVTASVAVPVAILVAA